MNDGNDGETVRSPTLSNAKETHNIIIEKIPVETNGCIIRG